MTELVSAGFILARSIDSHRAAIIVQHFKSLVMRVSQALIFSNPDLYLAGYVQRDIFIQDCRMGLALILNNNPADTLVP